MKKVERKLMTMQDLSAARLEGETYEAYKLRRLQNNAYIKRYKKGVAIKTK